MSMRLLIIYVTALGMLVTTAGADEYWITYEGNDLPENEGWQRNWGNDDGAHEGTGAVRTVENGVLTMDSLYDDRVYDYACRYLYGEVDPDPSELFIAEWRVNVEDSIGNGRDSMVVVASDNAMQLAFGLFPDYIESKWEDDVTLSITPGIFHDYRVLSWDMQTYELYIDGDLAHQGTFWQGSLESKLAWGDGVSGAASRTHWDYVRMGVVPEPASLMLLIGLCVCVRHRRTH